MHAKHAAAQRSGAAHLVHVFVVAEQGRVVERVAWLIGVQRLMQLAQPVNLRRVHSMRAW